MPSPNPFEYPIRARALKDARGAEINMRALEDFLKGLGTGDAGLQMGAKWRNNESDNTFSGGSLQTVYWNLTPTSWSDGYDDFVRNEGGETYDRLHVYTAGYYSATVFAYSYEGGDFLLEVHANTAAGGGESYYSFGLGASSSFEGESYATAFTAHSMEVDDYFGVRIKGTASDTFAAFVTIEYVAPAGGAEEVMES